MFECLWSFGFDDSAPSSFADSSDVLLAASATQQAFLGGLLFALPALLTVGRR
jgi:hypothetical protein